MNLSYSGLELLNTCERKFELEKMYQAQTSNASTSLDLVAGSSFGAGLQALLQNKSLEEAHWEAYKKWMFPNGTDKESVSIYEESKKKSFMLVSLHMQKYFLNPILANQGWEVWKLPNGRPAIEVGFHITLPNGYSYRGYIDAILQHFTGKLTALEIKTSGMENAHVANWQNSFQGMSYSLITDYISQKQSEEQLFFIAEFPKLGQQVMDFWRGPKDKYAWLPALALDMQRIETYKRNKHFPMRGSACYDYFRPCHHLGICNLSQQQDYVSPPPEDLSKYDYCFNIQELINFAKQGMN